MPVLDRDVMLIILVILAVAKLIELRILSYRVGRMDSKLEHNQHVLDSLFEKRSDGDEWKG